MGPSNSLVKLKVVLGTAKYETGVRSQGGLYSKFHTCPDKGSRSGTGEKQSFSRDI